MTVRINTGDGIKLAVPPPAAVNNYVANAISNNGGTTSISKSAAFTGAADAAVGTFSFWILPNSGSTDATQWEVFQFGSSNAMLIRRNGTTGVLRVYAENGAGTLVHDGTTSTTFLSADNTWHHVHITWDYTGTGSVTVTINGSVESMTWSTDPSASSATNVGFSTQGAGGIGFTNNTSGGARAHACFSDIYLDQTQVIAASEFIDGSGKPKDLSAVGSPIGLFTGDAAGFATNSGTGGNLTTLTAVTDCATVPST